MHQAHTFSFFGSHCQQKKGNIIINTEKKKRLNLLPCEFQKKKQYMTGNLQDHKT